MMLQSLNNTQPSFGMALVKPSTPEATKAFAKYVRTNEFCVNRGLKRFIKAQKGNSFNIVHDAESNAVKVLNPNGSVNTVFPIEVKKARKTSETDKTKYTFVNLIKGLWQAATQPERWLPKELKQAGRHASFCEKELAAKEKTNARAKQLELNAIKKTEEIFDSVK